MNESRAQTPPRYWPPGAGLGVPAGFRALPRPVLWLIPIAAGLLLLGVALRFGIGQPASSLPATEPAVATRLVARGQVHPVSYARIATLAGGTVVRLTVEVGDQVTEEQEIARVRGANGTEVVTAPWAGTVTSVPAHLGDTVLAGAPIATVGDLSRLRIETIDVDEFLIAHVRRGQWVRLTVDALDDYPLQGNVRSVALHQETTSIGDEHYPVVIELAESIAALRPGMTVRVHFAE
jgi:multidrug efflux pump subunit AcrA (membrane-fusion protein)